MQDGETGGPGSETTSPWRRAVLVVAALNLAYFVIEFVVARVIGSVSLVADSVDFLEDGALNLLIFFAAVWSVRRRARVGHALAIIILVPALATVWIAIAKIANPSTPSVVALSVTAFGALLVNLLCASVLVRYRHAGGSLAKAAWLSARNDALANLGILAAAAVTLVWASGWPDIVVGLAIGAVNADAGVKVWRAASKERLEARSARP
ncbi:cation transporter [Demequina sp. TTPB684]|uniref:cation transporter n=1 Tax=unclassified Demequina TaxID=2620311 RepID=UPI001CF4B3FF|nr:cation transporter [Demequina sp. TMPB413]MCB2412252.1 cation transporter [Demequina sp. TTPB684]UPU87109.1 cation transporter [Demequina sp. TMPB413]